MKLVKGAQTVIRYDPLWKTMAKKKATTYTLRVTFGMSHATVQRLQSNLCLLYTSFRAAAVEQLVIWGERVGVPVIKQKMGADPASVAFDTLSSAVANNAEDVYKRQSIP